MEYRDLTPFETVTFDALDKEDNEHHVVVMGGTFDIGPDGVLTLSEDQAPLAATDEYFGKTTQSSVRRESDFAPFKPRTDILLDAAAYAPVGKPLPSFTAGVTITGPSASAPPPPRPYGLNSGMEPSAEDLAAWEKNLAVHRLDPRKTGKVIAEKMLRITGPRYFKPSLWGSFTLTDPEPVTRLPIRYEQAFGGMVTVYDPETERDRTAFDDRNPIGIGYWPDWTHPEARRRKRVPVPCITSPSETLAFGKALTPQGFGPICRTWQPRLALAGTYDEKWQAGRWPNLPHDFDFGYWNCAHPDLQTPFLTGDEEIHLMNLTPEGAMKIALPGCHPFVLVRYTKGEIHEKRSRLDTVFIEPDKRRIRLVWRTVVPSEPDVRVLEARIKEAAHG
jgi:hypothetical protein